VSEFFLIGEYLAKLQANVIVSCTGALGQHTAKDGKSANNCVLACNFAKHSQIFLFFFTRRLSNKPFLIWLLTLQFTTP